MKLCLALISLLLCWGLIIAQERCPSICPAVYMPVCGEAQIGGQLVRCQFSNACMMGVNGCTNRINWRQTDNCSNLSRRCN